MKTPRKSSRSSDDAPPAVEEDNPLNEIALRHKIEDLEKKLAEAIPFKGAWEEAGNQLAIADENLQKLEDLLKSTSVYVVSRQIFRLKHPKGSVDNDCARVTLFQAIEQLEKVVKAPR
jgi:hypothetical protein